MKKLLSSVFFMQVILLSIEVNAQEKKQEFYPACIAFWNIENLFDTINDPAKNDEQYLPDGENKWNTERYLTKLDRLGQVISEIGTEFTPDGPAVLGLAEIENINVLHDLSANSRISSRKYIPILIEGPDHRGVDVALMYQPKYFTPVNTLSYTLKIPGDTSFATRDQLVVSGDLLGERFHFIVAHWPSRRGGEKRSRPLRIAAGLLGRQIIDSLMTADPNAKIMYMGDLNDDPVNESLKSAVRALAEASSVTEKDMFNPMYEMYKKGNGTLAYNAVWNLFDQILVSADLLKEDRSTFRYAGAKVFRKPYLLQDDGNYKGFPLRTYVGSTYMGGYADHLPVYVLLLKNK